jgi:hypothetical protein
VRRYCATLTADPVPTTDVNDPPIEPPSGGGPSLPAPGGAAAASRPPIPRAIAREVRQRCGFGCVVCGLPLYDYEHMEEWSVVKRHVATEITLLCNQHHREKTSGLLPIEMVREANADPYNLRAGVSPPYPLHFAGDTCETTIGSNTFTLPALREGETDDRLFFPLVVDGEALLSFLVESGRLLLSLSVYDDFNYLALRIADNQLQYSVRPRDIEFVGRRLTLRTAQKHVLLEMRLEVPNRVVIDRGRFLRNGAELLVRPNGVRIESLGGTSFSGTRATGRGAYAGIVVGPLPAGFGVGLAFPHVPRYARAAKETGER